MPIKAGGHVLTDKGWVVESLLPKDAKEEEGVYVLPEASEETEADVDEFNIGGDWFNIGGKQIHGRADAVRALQKQEASAVSMSNTKAELLEAAQAAGVDVDESMTKAEILEALEAE